MNITHELSTRAHIDATPEMMSRFQTYYEYLVEYNAHVNLTAITERDAVYTKHFLDSVLPQSFIPQGARVIDIGTGAGFPAVPLKIARPDIDITLVDSLNKRIEFLRQLSTKLDITSTTIHSRAEDLARTSHRESYDVCVSRAVANMSTLAEYCLPFVRVGGTMIAYKTENALDEIESARHAISTLGGEISRIERINLGADEGNRVFVLINKVKPTPKQYPRDKNKPKTQPL